MTKPKIYEFSELSEEAQRKAINTYRADELYGLIDNPWFREQICNVAKQVRLNEKFTDEEAAEDISDHLRMTILGLIGNGELIGHMEDNSYLFLEDGTHVELRKV